MFNTPAFWTGFFTLLATLTAIWQKDYLDRNKEYKHTLKQKAIKAYALANQLIYANNANSIICSNLIQDANYNYEYILKNYPNTIHEDLQKLELLIIENFFDLNSDFLILNEIITKEASSLLKIICNPKGSAISYEEFVKKMNKYQTDVITFSSNLRTKLIHQYINRTKPPKNIYSIAYSFKNTITNFFKNTK